MYIVEHVNADVQNSYNVNCSKNRLAKHRYNKKIFPVITVLVWRHITASNHVPHTFDIEVMSNNEHADY